MVIPCDMVTDEVVVEVVVQMGSEHIRIYHVAGSRRRTKVGPSPMVVQVANRWSQEGLTSELGGDMWARFAWES